MNNILNEKYITLESELTKKQDVFEYIADEFLKDKIITDKEEFINGLNKRESQSPTGFENSIAIPHVQSDVVTKTAVYIIRTKDAVSDYESLDPNNDVRLIFLIAVPKSSKGEHIKILSDLSTKLLDKDLVDKLLISDKEEIIKLLSLEKEKIKQVDKNESKGYVLAVTACATGIAHTYMTAEAIEKEAAKQGYEVKVEKQGASGIENEITKEDVKRASFVILAHDVSLKDTGRFNGLKYIDVKVAKPLHEPEKYFNMAKESNEIYHSDEEESTENEKKSKKDEMVQAVLTGISYMIPVIVAGGLLMGIAKLTALFIGGDFLVETLGQFLQGGIFKDALDNGTNISTLIEPLKESSRYLSTLSNDAIETSIRGLENGPIAFYTFLAYLDKIGSMIMLFMYPIFAMYLAYSIGKKNALFPGFLAGVFAQGLHTKIWAFDKMPSGIMGPFVGESYMSAVPSGFIGALILGFVAGYLVKNLNKIKIHKNLIALKEMLIIPGISVLTIVILSIFIVEPVFGAFNIWIQQLIEANQSSQYIYGTLIAAATAFDLGGPVNKAAGAVAISLAGDGTIAMTARTMAIVIPPLGLGLSTIFDSIFRTKIYSENEKSVGTTSFLLGFLAISEGAIPFMIKNPLIVIPINIIGAIIGSITAIALGAQMWLPLPAIWGWPLVEGSVLAYLIGLLVGTSFVAIANIIVRKALRKKI